LQESQSVFSDERAGRRRQHRRQKVPIQLLFAKSRRRIVDDGIGSQLIEEKRKQSKEKEEKKEDLKK
jgi:hypothetical protein